MSTFTTAMLVDLLDPVAAANNLGETTRAVIEWAGLLRNHRPSRCSVDQIDRVRDHPREADSHGVMTKLGGVRRGGRASADQIRRHVASASAPRGRVRWPVVPQALYDRSPWLDYERGRLRLTADMVVRFAQALEVTADELLGIVELKPPGKKPSRKILRRLEEIDSLRPHQQTILLKTIDTFLRGAAK